MELAPAREKARVTERRERRGKKKTIMPLSSSCHFPPRAGGGERQRDGERDVE